MRKISEGWIKQITDGGFENVILSLFPKDFLGMASSLLEEIDY